MRKYFFQYINYSTTNKLFKANHLAYLEPRWYGSRISADYQQKLLLTRHDTSGRFLLVTFLEKQNREDGTLFREIRGNWILRITLRVSLDLWILYHSIWIKTKSNHFKEKPSLVTIPTEIKTTRGKNVASTAITTLLPPLLPLSIQIFNLKLNK